MDFSRASFNLKNKNKQIMKKDLTVPPAKFHIIIIPSETDKKNQL